MEDFINRLIGCIIGMALSYIIIIFFEIESILIVFLISFFLSSIGIYFFKKK